MKLSDFISNTFAAKCLPLSAVLLFFVLPNYSLQAQIVPDPTVNSLVTPNGNTLTIDGGTKAGSNLFHSFSQFSIPTGAEAFFNNALDIQNIISRVTGSSISNIDGLIRANGTANLFLINPNGIIFGPNASLKIGGSFLGTTASSINFADGKTFSAINPQTPSLLTVSVPVGLGFGSNPAAIQVQGTGHNLTQGSFSPFNTGNSLMGLRVQLGKTLALVGGDVTLEGVTLTAAQGRIELGSVGAGTVSLSPTPIGWTLGYQDVQNFQDIRLSQLALLDTSGSSGGSIHVQGRRVELDDGSVMLIQNKGFQPAGQININASESVKLIGTTPNEKIPSGLFSETVGAGNGGDIFVSTKQLVIQGGGAIATRTYSNANSGNIAVNASESVELSGSSPNNPVLVSGIGPATYSSGNAGEVSVSTKRYLLVGGANTGSVTFGTGKGGDVIVNATESVELIGVQPLSFSPSALSASTANAGNAGSVTVNTSRLVVRDGGTITASTAASGTAGSVTINATKSVEISGTVPGSINPSTVGSSANIVDKTLRDIFGLPDQPSGNSGNLTINTPRLSVTDGAQVTVKNDGTGNAGTLTINANSIFLDNKGGITASTASGQGGNITLNVQNDLQLRNQSVISAEANDLYQTGKNITGGNIKINAGVIAAIPAENSDIIASADGQGGTITINTQGIFGLQVNQKQPIPISEITAIGKGAEAERNGIIELNRPESTVQNALNVSNSKLLTPEQAIASSCLSSRKAKKGTFFYTGTGGLALNPYDAIPGEYTVTNPQALAAPTSPQTSSPTPLPQASTPKTWKLGDPIQEAQGMTVTADGRLIVGTNPQLKAIANAQELICEQDQTEQKS